METRNEYRFMYSYAHQYSLSLYHKYAHLRRLYIFGYSTGGVSIVLYDDAHFDTHLDTRFDTHPEIATFEYR